MPTRPAEGRIAVGVFGVELGACVQKKLNGLRAGEGGGSVKGSFLPSAAIAHESSALGRGLRRKIRISASFQQHLYNQMLRSAVRRECGMQRSLSRVGLARVRVSTVLQKTLAELPMAVK